MDKNNLFIDNLHCDVYKLNGIITLAKPHWGLDFYPNGELYLGYAFDTSSKGRKYETLQSALVEFNNKQPKTNLTELEVNHYIEQFKR